MSNEKTSEKKQPEWGGFKGVIVPGSLKSVEDKLEAIGRTAEGKEHRIVAYPHMKGGAEALKAAAESGAEMVFRGPMLGSNAKGTFHFGCAVVMAPGEPKAKAEPKPELTEAEKAERSAKAREEALARDATRYPVLEGSVTAGGIITVAGNDVTVTAVGRSFELDADGATDINARFDGANFSAGDKIAYAKFEEPDMAPSI